MSKTVAKAVRALEHVRTGPLTLAALAGRLGVHPSTALRMLAPMLDAGLLARGVDGRYRLGLHLAELGQDVLDQFDLRAAAHPHLVELAAGTGCTAHLAQLVEGAIVYVDKVEAPGVIRTWSRIGRPVPLHTAAASKAILAGLPAPERARLLAGWEFTAHTPHTLTSADALQRHLDEVATRGWATDSAEFEPLVHCVGVALRTPREVAPAAVSLTAVRAAPTTEEIAAQVQRLQQAVAAVSRQLGGHRSGHLDGDTPVARR